LPVVDLLMALMAHEEEVIDVVDLSVGNPAVAPRPGAAEGVDVRLLPDVHLLLGDRRLPQRLAATGELAAAGGPTPEHALKAMRDVPADIASRVETALARGALARR
jgi:hypothetical protein